MITLTLSECIEKSQSKVLSPEVAVPTVFDTIRHCPIRRLVCPMLVLHCDLSEAFAVSPRCQPLCCMMRRDEMSRGKKSKGRYMMWTPMGINCYSIYLKTPFILLSDAAQTLSMPHRPPILNPSLQVWSATLRCSRLGHEPTDQLLNLPLNLSAFVWQLLMGVEVGRLVSTCT